MPGLVPLAKHDAINPSKCWINVAVSTKLPGENKLADIRACNAQNSTIYVIIIILKKKDFWLFLNENEKDRVWSYESCFCAYVVFKEVTKNILRVVLCA